MQCKDIPDIPILELLAKLSRGEIESRYSNQDGSVTTWHPDSGVVWVGVAHSVQHVMPDVVNEKLARAKMRMLIRRGLVDGCTCGCRGDFVITEKGEALLASINSCQAPPIC